MKRVAFSLIVTVLLITLALSGSAPVEAQSSPTWNSVIAYFNPNPGPLTPPEELSVVVYGSGGVPTYLEFNGKSGVPMLPFQSGTIMLGQLNNGGSFQGSAMVSATVPIMAVYKRATSDTEAYSPILYTSFDISQAGQGAVYIPSVRRLTAYDTQIGIQNVESLPIDLEISVYDAAGSAVHIIRTDPEQPVSPLNSFIFNMSSYAEYIPVPFEGSLVVRSFLAGTQVAARIVAAVQEVQMGGRRAFAYEGLTTTDHFLFIPTAACQAGDTAQTTTFTVQNAGAESTGVHIDYYVESGELIAFSGTVAIPPYASYTFSACDEDVLPGTQGQEMSAVVVSDREKIAVVGRLESSDGLMTAFTAQRMDGLASGTYRVVLPYVEWSTRANGFRTTIHVMNVGGEPAVNVKAYYYTSNGVSPAAVHGVGTPGSPLVNYTRRATSPVAARAVEARGFNGAVILESDQPIVALARVVRTIDANGYKTLGEDYNGIPYNP